MLEVAVLLSLLLVGFGLGCWVGYRQGCERTAQDWSERMRRIDPPPRRPGSPTNVDGPPARVSKPRIRSERRMWRQ